MIQPTSSTSGPEGLKRVRAASYSEAIEIIRREFGDEYCVVHTRVIPNQGKGKRRTQEVEVFLADVSSVEDWVSKTKMPAPVRDHGQPRDGKVEQLKAQIERLIQAREQRQERILGSALPAPSALKKFVKGENPNGSAASPSEVEPESPPQAAAEPVTFPATPYQKYAATPPVPTSYSATPAHAASPPPASTPAQPVDFGLAKPGHAVVRATCRILSELGVSPELSTELLTKIRNRPLPPDLADPEVAESLARAELRVAALPLLPPCQSITVAKETESRPRLIALVGPTGVGKTTSIAKIAIPLKVRHAKRVGIITLDSYRIGALDQIRRYGELVDIEVHSPPEGGDLRSALERFSSCDLVFVDTPGFSQRREDQIEAVSKRLSALACDEIHLCLPISASRDYLTDVARRFQTLGYNRLLLTKSDESVSPGPLLDLFKVSRCPVSYIACGQEVPEDIRVGTIERLQQLLFGGEA